MAFSIVGSIIIIYGGIIVAVKTLMSEIRRNPNYYTDIRLGFTSRIALGLEFFIAGDLIKTIIAPTFNEIVLLAVIVAIRTVVGYFLGKESKELDDQQKKKSK